jgi:hypothetical protein
MSMGEIAGLHRAIGELRRCVGELRTRYGDVTAIQRLANDVERLGIDATELPDGTLPPAPRGPINEHDVVVVPDTPYDPELWRGADDEGIGGHRH